MGIEWTDAHRRSGGGTELIARRLETLVAAELLDRFQIFLDRPGEFDPDRIPVLWVHGAPGLAGLTGLADGGWRRFAKVVFVSQWQAARIIGLTGVPVERTAVLPNFVEPLAAARFDGGTVRIVHTSMPNRGLWYLAAAFQRLCEEVDDVELDVYSSFRLYGWDARDREFEPLLRLLRAHPNVRYHGSAPNPQIRAALAAAHVYAYPCTFTETSCLALIEAMSAGLVCVHPDVWALPETAAGRTEMYRSQPGPYRHVPVLVDRLLAAVDAVRAGDPALAGRLAEQKRFADEHYGPAAARTRWNDLLTGLLTDVQSSRSDPHRSTKPLIGARPDS